ncbi:MAG: peptidase domain-containing ABC transporter [Bacilli bacterium]|nr:peptidase domain-containing ABC transporter [Bacilli bacterium]
MKKNIIIKQDGYKECGAACLLSIIRYYDGNIPINRLLELTCTNKEGTTFYNIKEASEKIGLEAQGFKIDNKEISSLKEIKLPSICQIIVNNYTHFIVLYKIFDNKILIMDPSVGLKKITIEKFKEMWTGNILIFSKKMKIPYINEEKYLNKLIGETIIKNKSIVLNIIIISLIYTIFSCLYSMYFQIIIDNLIYKKINILYIVTTIYGLILFIKIVTNYTRNKLLIYLNQKLDCTIFTKSFEKVLLLPYSYYKNKTTGEIVTRINDLAYVKNMLSKIILTVFLDIILSLFCSIFLLVISKKLFIILIITILIYIILFYIFKPILKKYTKINQENNAIINSNMIEIINSYETIKNLNIEEKMNDKIDTNYAKGLKDNLNYQKIINIEIFIKDLITYLNILIIELVGFKLISINTLSIGKLITFITLTTFFIEPIRNIIDLNKEYYYAINSLRRANNLLDIEETDIKTKTNYIIKGNIKIKNLSYSYNNYNNILNNINIDIKKGDKVLLIGESGSGKSTIIKILSKYYSPNRNTVYLDDIDLNDISTKNLKDNLITISQDETLLNDTIRNNITLGRDIDDNNFNKICKLLKIEDFVKNMFLGYNTKLEENGKNISGGQRQRIILARALLKPANIILIDEGLNAIDINLERIILKNLFKEYKNKTIIIISHKTDNKDLFNKIIKLSKGRIENEIKKSKESYIA